MVQPPLKRRLKASKVWLATGKIALGKLGASVRPIPSQANGGDETKHGFEAAYIPEEGPPEPGLDQTHWQIM